MKRLLALLLLGCNEPTPFCPELETEPTAVHSTMSADADSLGAATCARNRWANATGLYVEIVEEDADVKVTTAKPAGRRLGDWGRKPGGAERIRVAPWLTPLEAHAVVMHELGHHLAGKDHSARGVMLSSLNDLEARLTVEDLELVCEKQCDWLRPEGTK